MEFEIHNNDYYNDLDLNDTSLNMSCNDQYYLNTDRNDNDDFDNGESGECNA